MRYRAAVALGCLLLVTIIFDTSTEAAEPVPTLTSVSIDSNNAISSGTDEFATVGDTVTLSFTANDTIHVPTVTFTVGGTSAAGSITVTNAAGEDWSAIATGRYHTVGLKSNGTLWTWGDNTYGQIGDGSTVNKDIPTQESTGATNWSAISAGRYHTVALRSDGTLWTWGYNYHGQLGDGADTVVHKDTPAQELTGATNWSAIAAGEWHTVGLKTDGTLWAWGDNTYGQLGDGPDQNRKRTPTQIGVDTWSTITAGYEHTIGLKSNGTLWAWGDNTYGQLGDGTTRGDPEHTAGNPTPRKIRTSIATFDLVAGDTEAVVAFTIDFGDMAGNTGSQGFSTTDGTSVTFDKTAPTLTSVSIDSDNVISDETDEIATMGDTVTLSFTTDEAIQTSMVAFTVGGDSAVGSATTANLSGNDWTAAFILASGDTGSVVAFTIDFSDTAGNSGSQVTSTTDGTSVTFDNTAPTLTSVSIDSDSAISSRTDEAAAVGDTVRLAFTANETIHAPMVTFMVGDVSATGSVTVANAAGEDWSAIATGRYHTVGLKSDGTLWTWGGNNRGQLGDGTITSRYTPTQESTGATNWSAIATGENHTVALKSNGTLWSWGDNSSGQLGDGTYSDRHTPTQESTGATDWSAIAVGKLHTVALKSDGTLWAWGFNASGQFGDGTSSSKITPTQESTRATNWSAIAAGAYHTVALRSDGTLWAWGSNSLGQLGDGTNSNKITPTQESTGAITWSAIATGRYHTVALRSNGTLWAWGNNHLGQLGDGTSTSKTTPTQESTRATNWAWGDNSSSQLGTAQAWHAVPMQTGTGTDWTAAFTLASGDIKSMVAFTIDFISDTARNAGTHVTETTDGSSVTLADVPGAPSDVYAPPGDHQAIVSWTAPTFNGGSAITKYTVISSPGGVTVTTTDTSVTVPGLTNGTTYTFTVTAANSIGTSASSATSNAVTPAPPTPPVAYSQEVNTIAGVPVTITLTGSDANWDSLGWAIIQPVNEGAIQYLARSQTTNTIDVVFTPSAGFTGTASFRFYATDSSSAGNTATVNINVTSAVTPTPTPASEPIATPTPIPNIWNAPSTSSWGLVALVLGMLVVMIIALRLTSGARPAVRP